MDRNGNKPASTDQERSLHWPGNN